MLSLVTDMESDDVITLAVKSHNILWLNVVHKIK